MGFHNKRNSTYKEFIRPILNIAIYSGVVFLFLVVAYNLILGGAEDVSLTGKNESSKVQDKNVQAESVLNKVASPAKEAVKDSSPKKDTSGMSGIKVADIDISTVRVYITEENKIEEIPIEEYIKGVVASEMPLNFSKEALKAQAIAARTYTVAHVKSIGGGCSRHKGADLCDTVHCQVYTPKDKKIAEIGSGGQEKWKLVEEAVNETKDMVMSYGGDLVTNAFYFSTSSGRTENCEDVFSTKSPYLKSVESPGEDIAPRYTDSKSFDLYRFAEIINSEYNNANVSPWDLKSQIQILSHTDGGAVKEIKTGNVTMTGVNFRRIFGLNSANFQLEFLDNEVVVDCKGFGHGVGMSQWGANVMAKAGSSCEEILKHYYTGIEIEKISEK